VGFVQLRLNHMKENVGRAYSRLRMTRASRDYWKDATASLDQTFRHIRRLHRGHDLQAVAGQGRREVVRRVIQRVGQENFKMVLTVYDYCCAVCDVQLELVEAAHIIPVPIGGDNRTASDWPCAPSNTKLTVR